MKKERVWLTPYNYCQNNPINRVDPTGALDEDPPNLKQSFQIDTNENGEITSVSISEITNIVYGENGEIVSGVGKAETHQHLLTLKESELYNSLNDALKQELSSQLDELNPNSFDNQQALLNIPDYSKNDGIVLEDNNKLLESPEIPTIVGKTLAVLNGLKSVSEKILGLEGEVKYARRHPEKLRKINPDVWKKFYKTKATKALRVVKGIGRALGIVSTIGSIHDAFKNPTAGNILQAATNLALLGARINPATGIALAVADATGLSDYVFDTLGEAIMKVDFERHIRNSWSVAPIF